MNRVVGSINIEVKAEVEEVLMMRSDYGRGYEVTRVRMARMRNDLGFSNAFGKHDTAQGSVNFQHAILMKDPVNSVVVVSDCGDERDYQFPRPARFILFRIGFIVFPEQAAVALVDRDGSFQNIRLAIIAGKRGVDHRSVFGRIGFWLDGTGEPADAVLADIKRAAPTPGLVGIAVGHDHL